MSRWRPAEGRLADGRAIYLYGDHGTPGPVPPDRRLLPPVRARSELRWDAATEEWVICAPHRTARPRAEADQCALCPAADGGAAEIPAADYDVAVFENRFPALGTATASPVPAEPDPWAGLPAGGRCEVVSFSGDHHGSLARLPLQRVRTVLEALADRSAELNRLPEVAQVVCFENRGAQIGATLAHPHGQIYAYPFVPSRLLRMQQAAARAACDGCLFCRIVAEEERVGERVVLRTAHWTAFVPYAARWPYEVHLYARRHVADLAALSGTERADLAVAYRAVLRMFERVAGEPLPYMALWIQAPARTGRALSHLQAQVFSDRFGADRAKRLAAGELGAGAFVSESQPERAAGQLRAVPVDD